MAPQIDAFQVTGHHTKLLYMSVFRAVDIICTEEE
jgi:hypothetical protein